MIDVEHSGPKIKVAIIGGGIGGLTTALELTATEELRARHEVTIHQMGWRLGGKCATGRNPDQGFRIEEHGLHLWFGGYDNAFALLDTCYRELARPSTSPVHSIADAFEALDAVTLYDRYKDGWSEDYQRFPIEPGTPWDTVAEPRLWDLIVTVVDWMRGTKIRFSSRQHLTLADKIRRTIGDVIEDALTAATFRYIDRHRKRRSAERRAFHWSSWILRLLRGHSWRRRRHDLDAPDIRHRAVQADVVLTCLIGMIDDEVMFRGFDAINDLDFCDWLRKHGAQPLSLEGTSVRVTYDQCFAGRLGPRVLGSTDDAVDEQAGTQGMAAGAAVYSMLRTSMPWRGSTMWRARAGMGDTVIAPMYQVLAQRGVKVEFFRRAEALHLSPDRHTIDEVIVRRQAETASGDAYLPLHDVKGLPCWPNRPLWDQLVDGETLRASEIDFESEAAAGVGTPQTLRRGEDFDVVVMAVSAAALPSICGELVAANPAFAGMLRETRTTMTQAFQLWLNISPGEVLTDPPMPLTESLGYRGGRAATSTFTEPLDTGCDMAQVLPYEDWPATEAVRSAWYFCGVLPDEAANGHSPTDADQRLRARSAALEYLGQIGVQWPSAVNDEGFRWEVLAGAGDAVGAARFEAQYWRANCSPTERYVQTPPASVDSRLTPDGSGFKNLLLAGDWTKNGFNIGAVEATVMAGMLASRALCGSPQRIAWDNHEWLIDS